MTAADPPAPPPPPGEPPPPPSELEPADLSPEALTGKPVALPIKPVVGPVVGSPVVGKPVVGPVVGNPVLTNPVLTNPGLGPVLSGSKVVPGAQSVVGSLLLGDALNRLDATTRASVDKVLANVLPQVLAPGTVAADRTVPPADLASLIPSSAVSAAGLDLARTATPPPPVLWDDGSNRLLVVLAGVTATLGDGVIELTIPVTCDQTGAASVTVTFVTGTDAAPTGGVATTEDHPRGPAAVVEVWYEPLIAFAWQTVLIATAALAGAVGTDTSGGRLIPSALAVSADGLTVTPMAQHTFLLTNRLP